MKINKWIKYLILSIFLTSCNSKTPESIIGIRLGAMANENIKQAESNGLLLRDPNGSYINLPNNIKGYTTFYTTIQNNFIDEVIVRFCSNDNTWNVPLLNVKDKATIVELYENKYGVCRPFKDGDQFVLELDQEKSAPTEDPGNYHEYNWKKGHLILTLSFIPFDEYGKNFY